MNETELIERLVDADVFTYADGGACLKRTEESDTAAESYEELDTEDYWPCSSS